MCQLRSCVEEKELHPLISFSDTVTKEKVLIVWKAWLDCDWRMKKMKGVREKYLEGQSKYTRAGGARGLAEMYARPFIHETGEVKRRMTEEVRATLESGCIFNGSRSNPTFLLVNPDGTFLYAVHYGAHPFEGIHPLPNKSLTDSLLSHIYDWKAAFLAALPRIAFVAFNASHALHFLDTLISQRARFDVIDTPNLCDVVGLLNLLVPCSPLLAIPGMSLLKACSFFHARYATNHREFLESVTCLSSEAHPTLLGLAVPGADPYDWATFTQPFCWADSQLFPDVLRQNVGYYTFVKTSPPEVPIALSESPFLVDTILTCANGTLCSSHQRFDEMGGCKGTPQTLAKLLAFAFAEQRLSVSSKPNTFP
eukprot:TRINITY_DN4894_c0_g2_i1.p1 TRINITY_DN4894_c0_g2~~TRINITY_DN4894_c0_g2_i1.p1  ORF type:complete len:367 (-),score=33.99 TRINITY_DN4894_c0_g2_i1:694-1794(-)